MRAETFSLLALGAASAVLGGLVSRSIDTDVTGADGKESDQLAELAQAAYDTTQSGVENNATQALGSVCSWQDIRIRREWGALSSEERLDYIRAVRCFQSLPALTPASKAPGAKTRFDDFVATHSNQTLTIHRTGNFLSWHRYFVWQYEEALRNECGYGGMQPYWDWSITATTGMEQSPIFDGSETSMSGNGDFIPNRTDIIMADPVGALKLPVGTGGGCVTSGPFKDMVVNLGPAALVLPGGHMESNPNGSLAYNPRCLKRDLSTKINQRYANITSVLSNILGPQNVADFQEVLQGLPGSGDVGVHSGGHFSIGGDPGFDVFTSPGEPVFYLHHAMVDRVWWMWQMMSPEEREYGAAALSGTNTFLNMPPSANTTFDDYLQYGWAGGKPLKIRDAMSTVAGPFCYVYL